MVHRPSNSSPPLVTPLFSISQTQATLTLAIRAPHCRPHDVEVSAEGPDFTFFCNPYALSLSFDHSVYLQCPIDAPPTHTTYDFTTGIAHITLRKTTPGTHFQKLDLPQTLLLEKPLPPTTPPPFAAPSIQVISSTSIPHHTGDPPKPSDNCLETLSEPQSVTRTLASLNEEFANTTNISGLDIPLRELTLTRPTYGFASRYEAVFRVRAEDSTQIVLLPDPDTTPVWRRPALRKAAEDAKFDPDHYIADFLLEHEFAHAFEYSPKKRNQVQKGLEDLPKREYLPSTDQYAAADLAGILFASLYDERITSGERNVETPWTVSRISPTMSFLEQMHSPREAVLAAYRRSLAYPLCRSVKLADLVLADMKLIFEAETAQVRHSLLSILMELRDSFESDPMLRLHCDLFLIDYCVWIQSVRNEVLENLGKEIVATTFERNELEWDLDALEIRALRMANGEEFDDEGIDGSAVYKEGEEPCTRSVGNQVPRNEVVITAHSTLPSPGLECTPIRNTVLKPPQKYGPPEVPSSSSDYDSDSSCTTASTDS